MNDASLPDELPPPPGWRPPPSVQSWGELAPWGPRACGFLIDSAIWLAIGAVGAALDAIISAAVPSLGFVVGLLGWSCGFAFWIIQLIKQGRTGQTVGQRLAGLKLVNADTGQLVGGGTAVLRSVAHIVDSIACYIGGWLLPLWDKKRQTLADKLVGTVVVRVPRQPFRTVDLYTTT